MKLSKNFVSTALVLAVLVAPLASAANAVILNEKFNNFSALSGWTMTNQSTPVGLSWFQGNAGVFGAQAGPAGSYIAANFLSADQGGGTIDNWLITPQLSLGGATQLSFFTRAQALPGFNDMLELRFSASSGADAGGLSTLLATIGGPDAYPNHWQQFTANLNFAGDGRFAFRYVGDAAVANYIGIDTVRVMTAVPEPTAYLMLGIGMAVLSLLLPKSRT
ncbi:MAG: choice-of-anchor J domain-containing protein [Pseudomonadota bacterium]|nr:choice-of-anchor J domain-containing protein [Pseudomonadota bacterium]